MRQARLAATGPGRRPAPGRLAALLVLAALGGAACSPEGARPAPAVERHVLTAEIVQLRRDEVLERVEVALRNDGRDDVTISRLRLTVPGFTMPGFVPKDSPVPAGQVVNLPVPYLGIACPEQGAPDVGTPRVTVETAGGSGQPSRTVRVPTVDPDGLMSRIAARTCAVEQLGRDVSVRLGERWRLGRGPEGEVLRGQLVVSLLQGTATHSVTQVQGAIMYGLRPARRAANGEGVLGRVSVEEPRTVIPVVAYAARCDPHTIGEIKKPYAFLVWVTDAAGSDVAVTPEVGEGTRTALRQVCAF